LFSRRLAHKTIKRCPSLVRGNILFKGQIKVADMGKPSTAQPLHSDDVFIQKAVRIQGVASRTPPFASP
jgi:hypothetical protein